VLVERNAAKTVIKGGIYASRNISRKNFASKSSDCVIGLQRKIRDRVLLPKYGSTKVVLNTKIISSLEMVTLLEKT
jgi:hypothetical protein